MKLLPFALFWFLRSFSGQAEQKDFMGAGPAALSDTSLASGASADAPFTFPPETYLQKLTCPNGPQGGPKGIALLVPCTGGLGREVYEKSLYPEGLAKVGIGHCWIDLPGASTGDMQLSAEFVAFAVQHLASTSGQSITIVTYSQGGANVQWALLFWPSLRGVVRTFSAMAPPMRGSASSNVVCTAFVLIGGCLPAILQMGVGSRYMTAVNAGEGAKPLVPTTIIYSWGDQIVIPQTPQSVSTLPGASNILMQDLCGPFYVLDHFMFPALPAVFAVVIDAAANGRPANPQTIDTSTCSVAVESLTGTLGTLPNDLRYIYRSLIGSLSGRLHDVVHTLLSLRTKAEPLLQPYVCRRGFANECGPPGFRDSEKFLLADLPLLGAVKGLLGGQSLPKHGLLGL